MKFSCEQTDLNTALVTASKAVSSRPSHPILGQVLVEADAETQQVKFTGFDLEMLLSMAISAQVIESGRITIPTRLATDIVGRMPSNLVFLETENNVVKITSGKGKYEIPFMNASQYPDLPTLNEERFIEFPTAKLLAGLKACGYAMSSDSTKPVLGGIHLMREGELLEFAATDGHRLAVFSDRSSAGDGEVEAGEEMAITIPAKAIHELIKVIEKQRPPTVTCGIDAVQIAFFLEGLQVIARAIDSAYPRYHQLIPDRFKGTVTLERSSFLSALERVAIVASQKNDIIKLEVPPLETPSPMFLRAEVADVGGGVEALDVEVAGSGGVDIGINGKYLAEALKAIKADKVTFNFNTPASPVVIFPVSGGADLVSTHLLMPVQLRGDK